MAFKNTPPNSSDAFKAGIKPTSRFPLSTSIYGEPVGVGTSATTIHVPSSTPGSGIEDLYIWASNYGASNVNLTMSIGSEDLSNQPVIVTLSSKNGFVLVYPGIPVSEKTVFAKASASGSINVSGFVVKHAINVPDNTSSGYDSAGQQ